MVCLRWGKAIKYIFAQSKYGRDQTILTGYAKYFMDRLPPWFGYSVSSKIASGKKSVLFLHCVKNKQLSHEKPRHQSKKRFLFMPVSLCASFIEPMLIGRFFSVRALGSGLNEWLEGVEGGHSVRP